MGKINDTDTYSPQTPALTDHVPGTDVSDTGTDADGETVTFLLSAILALFEANFRAASATQTGTIEIATATETGAGTDTTRAISPDALARSVHGQEVITLPLFDDSEDVATGDGAGGQLWRVPSKLNGWILREVAAYHETAGTGAGSDTTDVQIHNVTQAVDMLSTKLTIDEDETDSAIAADPAVIDTDNDDVATGDKIRIDVDAVVSGTAPKGLWVQLTFLSRNP